ncbi:MAG: MATE family efflux transporter [Clostridia bacterium]|nr:MATE family efflux transporter [Clostridia bacterium]
MSTHGKKVNIDMVHGPLFSNVVRYTIPIILTGILQLLFNAADLIVIGRFRGSESVGAVGATGSLTSLFINLFIGISAGVSVVAANAVGAKDKNGLHKTVHTAIPIAIIGGIILSFVGIVFCEPILKIMDTPPEILPKSAIYMKIYFGGIIFSLVYNFGAAILRAVGDTKSPFVFLTIGGVANVILNVIFVTAFGMDVEGVAIATVVSQAIAAVLVVIRLVRTGEEWRLVPGKMRIYPTALKKIFAIGLPAGVQSVVFALSNVIIQAAGNGFGASAVAGIAAASNIESFIYITMNAFYQTTMNFTGQNVGAGNIGRIPKIVRTNVLTMFSIAIVMGVAAFAFARPLLSIYIVDDPAAIEAGVIRMTFICLPYFVCGIMEICAGVVRGMGNSIAAMLTAIISVCGIRIVWIYTIFQAEQFHSLESLYISYLISWIACIIGHITFAVLTYKKLKMRMQN